MSSLEYENKNKHWKLQKTSFDMLTLFVGISGVGKSRILAAIASLRSVVLGRTQQMGGVGFTVECTTGSGKYRWHCQFAPTSSRLEKDHYLETLRSMGVTHAAAILPMVQEEWLELEGERIFERDAEKVTFRGITLPAVNPKESMLLICSGEPVIKELRDAILRIFQLDFSEDKGVLVEQGLVQLFQNEENAFTPQEVVASDIPVISKLAYYFVRRPEVFQKIKEKFMEVFPQVEDLYFRPGYEGRYFVLYMKERSTDEIPQEAFSSGMFKTLMFLAQMAMLEGSCVVLIDEIENSLGLNCIDILTEELAMTESDDQFFLTSHHPYIINNIDMSYWRIVQRKGGTVRVKTAREVGLGDSCHEAYFQLINADGYNGGIG